MVSVSKIENTFAGMRKNDMSMKNGKSNTLSFGKRPNAAIAGAIVENSSKFTRALETLGQNDGEILNSLVTFFGTAFVAPIFIAFNPFAKEDKETKIYSAWRQPISALIAAVMQVGVNIKYNHHLNKLASTGLFERADLRAAPLPSYLRAKVKHDHPDWNKKQVAEEVERLQFAARDAAIVRARDEFAGKSLEEFNKITTEALIDEKTRKIAEKQIKAEKGDAFKKLSKEEAKALVDKRAGILVNQQIDHSANVKNTIREWLDDVVEGAGKQRKYTRTFEEFIAAKENFLTLLPENDPNRSVIQEAVDKLKRYAEEIRLQVQSQESVLSGLPKDATKRSALQETIEHLRSYGGFERIRDHGKTFEQIRRNVVIKNYVLANTEKAKAVLKSYNRWTGLFISLATLPLSCGLLNFAYPRIMEKIMPEIAAKRKEKQAQENAANVQTLNAKEGSN